MSNLLKVFGEAINTKAIGGGGITGTEEEGNGLTDKIAGIVNAIIGVLGIVAVVVIILGGISYMTSNGDATKVKKAKDTILYGVIGLVIVILSAAIVNFVIFKVAGTGE
ncbi:hypothetical protein J6T21_01225 [Candidatus Saccharibacteria bacterium]|nr:hypothetical protein [Candidatus Saccharibacteria bacterium]